MIKFIYPEGATPIDADEEKALLLYHITTQAELNRWEQDNIAKALAWLEKTKPDDIFNEKFIKNLHKRMFGDVWKWAGTFRQTNKNIGVSWHQITMSLNDMFEDAGLWLDLREDEPDLMAVRLHHRLVSIHPFVNGNGRHARLMTDIFLENVLKVSRFSWGSSDLSNLGDVRKRYIAALHAADGLDFRPLLLFARS